MTTSKLIFRDVVNKSFKKLLKKIKTSTNKSRTKLDAEKVSSKKTLSAWLVIYRAAILRQNFKPQTIKNRTAILNHIESLWGSRPIQKIQPHEISTGLAEISTKHPSTAQRILRELKTVYFEAIANEWADKNPTLYVKAVNYKVQRRRLSFETWQLMLDESKQSTPRWVEPMLLLALITGQRRADLAAMKFEDIQDGYLYIEQQKHAGKGYGARIALPLDLRLDAIGMTLADVIEKCKSCAKPGPTLLRRSGGNALELSSLSIRFHSTIKSVTPANTYAITEWPSLHEVRSLSARLFKAQGVDTQTLLGHKHAEMTALYEDDRGLSANQFKRLVLPIRIRSNESETEPVPLKIS
jgi:integrase